MRVCGAIMMMPASDSEAEDGRGGCWQVYLSEQLRVSRGNKGTTFVLRRR